jgi:hypothetical protein
MTSLKITATIEGATSGIVGRDFSLDGPLAWAEAAAGNYSPITPDHAPEIQLPLEKWQQGDLWGWKCSRAHYEVASYGSLEIRRKPTDREYARFTGDKKNHHALGPYKARDLVIETAIIPTISWDVECVDEKWLKMLISRLTHLGSHRAIGLGKVAEWTIKPGELGAWEDRSFDAPTRPPYWHQERKSRAAAY